MFRVLLLSLFFLFLSTPLFAAEESSWLESETIGDFSMEMEEKSLKEKLICDFKRDKEQWWGADGLYHQTWSCPSRGIDFDMSSQRKGGSKIITRITITAPSQLKTKRGIGIGSSEQEVIRAYNNVKESQATRPKETFVAGSVFGGLFFDFQNGKVVSIMLGAAAE
ncbi:MAG: hypothetical protein KU38_03030 [Sulfurovum sp. FS08-3]|nr:MAG: hypothetical protein KU38_03030 [Sulfurovum sp. FS08-3]